MFVATIDTTYTMIGSTFASNESTNPKHSISPQEHFFLQAILSRNLVSFELGNFGFKFNLFFRVGNHAFEDFIFVSKNELSSFKCSSVQNE